jgi:predicted nucleotidyltransferase
MKPREIPQSVRLALEELKAALVELYGERLEGVYLYGSYARGDFTEDSDIDVLVVLQGDVKPGAEITRLSPLLSEICLRHDVLISTYPVPATWLRERQSPLFINIRREGVPIGEFLERTNHAGA